MTAILVTFVHHPLLHCLSFCFLGKESELRTAAVERKQSSPHLHLPRPQNLDGEEVGIRVTSRGVKPKRSHQQGSRKVSNLPEEAEGLPNPKEGLGLRGRRSPSLTRKAERLKLHRLPPAETLPKRFPNLNPVAKSLQHLPNLGRASTS